MDGTIRTSWLRSRTGRSAVAGIAVAVGLIAGSVGALDRQFLGHSDWDVPHLPGGGVLVLGPSEEPLVDRPGGARLAEETRRLREDTGGTPAPERSRPRGAREADDPDPEPVAILVRLGEEPASPAVVRSLPGDADDDGLTDRLERRIGTSPRSADTDGDGLPDGWEEQHGLDPRTADDATDADGDGLLNRTEFRVRSNPRVIDTNHDGTPDGDDDADDDRLPNIVEQGLSGAEPDVTDTNGDGTPDGDDDTDGDGIPNAEEVAAGTDPAVAQPAEPPAPATEEPVVEPEPAAEPEPAEETGTEPPVAPEPGPVELAPSAP